MINMSDSLLNYYSIFMRCNRRTRIVIEHVHPYHNQYKYSSFRNKDCIFNPKIIGQNFDENSHLCNSRAPCLCFLEAFANRSPSSSAVTRWDFPLLLVLPPQFTSSNSAARQTSVFSELKGEIYFTARMYCLR